MSSNWVGHCRLGRQPRYKVLDTGKLTNPIHSMGEKVTCSSVTNEGEYLKVFTLTGERGRLMIQENGAPYLDLEPVID